MKANMKLGKKRMLTNVFFNSQFNYCPVIWMCHSRALNNKINRLHERCLRIICNDKTYTFKELLEKDNSVLKHYRNIQALAIEMYRVAHGMSPQIMNEIFQLRENLTLLFHRFIVFTMVASLYLLLFEKWLTLDPKIFYAIPFQKLVFLISLYPGFLEKKTKK